MVSAPGALTYGEREDIIAEYLLSIRDSEEENEAVSTEGEDALSDSNLATTPKSKSSSNSDIAEPFRANSPEHGTDSDIRSGDEFFSSTDEFGDESTRQEQKDYQNIVLGDPPEYYVDYMSADVIGLRNGFLDDLDAADEELERLTGMPKQVIVAGEEDDEYNSDEVENDDPALSALIEKYGQQERYVLYLRQQRRQEVEEEYMGTHLSGEVVLLAQALFRREREIKQVCRVYVAAAEREEEGGLADDEAEADDNGEEVAVATRET